MTSRATAIGFTAILMWSLLALMTAASGRMPPFQLAAITFLIGSLPGLVMLAAKPARIAAFRQPWPVWATGIAGLFGYHFFYFTALRNAPPAEAGLIAYLWPLFIVLGSALLPGEKLRLHHILGALLGLAGSALIVARNGVSFDASYTLGYLMALACAFTWSCYSLMSRKFGAVPTDAVTAFCLATSALSFVSHMALEQTIWPESAGQWVAVVGLGLFPVGLAFYTWDYGVKKGDIQLLGAASYAAPLLSTGALILGGFAEPGWRIAAAGVLITLGAVVAAKDLILRKQQAS